MVLIVSIENMLNSEELQNLELWLSDVFSAKTARALTASNSIVRQTRELPAKTMEYFHLWNVLFETGVKS
jgi:hypothetical protein